MSYNTSYSSYQSSRYPGQQADSTNPFQHMKRLIEDLKSGKTFDIQEYISVMDEIRELLGTMSNENKNFKIFINFFSTEGQKANERMSSELDVPDIVEDQKIPLTTLLNTKILNDYIFDKMNTLETIRKNILHNLTYWMSSEGKSLLVERLNFGKESSQAKQLEKYIDDFYKALKNPYNCPNKECEGRKTGLSNVKTKSGWFSFSRKKSLRRPRKSKSKASRRKHRKSKGKSKLKSRGKSKRKSRGKPKFPLRSRR